MKQRPDMIDQGGKTASIIQPAMLRKGSKTIQVKDHAVKSGNVAVLNTPPTTPARKWSGVVHDQGDILYLRATSLASVHEWLVKKGLGRMDTQEDGTRVLTPIGCYVDTIGDIVIEPATFDYKDLDDPKQLTPPVMASGFHVNVRLLNL